VQSRNTNIRFSENLVNREITTLTISWASGGNLVQSLGGRNKFLNWGDGGSGGGRRLKVGGHQWRI